VVLSPLTSLLLLEVGVAQVTAAVALGVIEHLRELLAAVQVRNLL
jgi:hypothetical protein